MKTTYLWPVAGVAAAIAITATMDATGYSLFSALPLLPLAGLFWYLQGFSRAEIGLIRGPAAGWALAVACPVLVLAAAGVAALLAGAVDVSGTDWNKTLLNVGLMTVTGILMGILTEEGFFRGWLWASLRRAGASEYGALAWTSLAFTAWHVSAITLDPDFSVPAAQVPVYLVNATLLGLTWGLLRLLSGSVVVASVAHAFWNGIDYPLYGFGVKTGALGIEQTHIFGPEVGWLGIILNVAAVAALLTLARRTRAAT